MNGSIWLLACVLVSNFLGSARAQSLTPASTGPEINGWAIALVGTVIVAVVLILLARKGKLGGASAVITADVAKAEVTIPPAFHNLLTDVAKGVSDVRSKLEAMTSEWHGADVEHGSAGATLQHDTGNTDATKAALAKLIVSAATQPSPIPTLTAIVPAAQQGTPATPTPPAELAPAPSTFQPIGDTVTDTRDASKEMPLMADWLNGTTDNFGKQLTPPAHPEIVGAFQRYFTTMEDVWTANPDWGTGPDSYEKALQAAMAKLAPSGPRSSLPLPTTGVDALVVSHYVLQNTVQEKARFYSDNQRQLGPYMLNLPDIGTALNLLSRNLGHLLTATYDPATNAYTMPDGRGLGQWSLAELGMTG